MEKFSVNKSFNRQIIVSQPEKGYRFSLDPLLLAAHIHPKGRETVLDIGCGCGIISLVLASRYPGLKITGIEIQEELYTFACQNVLANGLNKNIRLVHDHVKNIRNSTTNAKADIIVSNPPYKKSGTGRLNPDPQKAMARHEICLDMDMLFECSSRLLKNQGLLFIIFPFDRLPDLTLAMDRHYFYPEFIRHVHIRKGAKAKRVILCAGKNSSRQPFIYPPLYIYTPDNKFTDEYLSLFRT